MISFGLNLIFDNTKSIYGIHMHYAYDGHNMDIVRFYWKIFFWFEFEFDFYWLPQEKPVRHKDT